MPDYGNDIAKAKQKALDALDARIDEISKPTYELLLKIIEDTFDFNEGKAQDEKDFINQLNKLTTEVLDLIHSDPKFTGSVSQFVKRVQPTSDTKTGFQKETKSKNDTAFDMAKKILVDEIIDKLLDNGLNQNFVQLLKALIYQNVTSGLSLADATKQIEEYIDAGNDINGELEECIEETAIQAVSAYNRMISTKLMEKFQYDGIQMTGSLIDNSSPQCRYVIEELGGKITRENWPEVKAIAEKNGLVEGTTFDNLPFNLLHWYCRHDFFPIIIKKT